MPWPGLEANESMPLEQLVDPIEGKRLAELAIQNALNLPPSQRCDTVSRCRAGLDPLHEASLLLGRQPWPTARWRASLHRLDTAVAIGVCPTLHASAWPGWAGGWAPRESHGGFARKPAAFPGISRYPQPPAYSGLRSGVRAGRAGDRYGEPAPSACAAAGQRPAVQLEVRSDGRASGLGRAGSSTPDRAVAVPWARPALRKDRTARGGGPSCGCSGAAAHPSGKVG